jgi:hypothetical protein
MPYGMFDAYRHRAASAAPPHKQNPHEGGGDIFFPINVEVIFGCA